MAEQDKIEEIIGKINALNIGEISQLINLFKERYNIKEDAMLVTNASAPQNEKKEEEKSGNVSIKLISMDAVPTSEKLQVYKVISAAVRELKGEEISAVQAKKMVDKANEGDKIIIENIPRAKAEEIKQTLTAKGMYLEIKEI
jgi:ribosomal protein L7/L12